MNRILVSLALVLLAVPASAGPVPPRFAIYRVDLVSRSHDHQVDPTTATQDVLRATAIRSVAPVLTDEDVLEYCWPTQRLLLTPEAAARWNALGGHRAPLAGLPLQIWVDGEPRYGAMLWNPASSRSCRLPQIWSMAMEGRIHIGCRYRNDDGEIRRGDCYDPEVERVMRELGKLGEDCGEGGED